MNLPHLSQTQKIFFALALAMAIFGIYFGFIKKDTAKPTTLGKTTPTAKPTTLGKTTPTASGPAPPVPRVSETKPPKPEVVDVAVLETKPPKPEVVDVAVLVGVLPDAIDVRIESDDPVLRGFSGTYYYSFSVSRGWDPRIGSWAWTLDSVAAPGGNGYRGETRAQLSYSNEEGKWNLSLNTLDPYPQPSVLFRATTGPLDKWNSVWGAKWIRIEPLSTIDSKRTFDMPLIKVSARGSGVIAQWT